MKNKINQIKNITNKPLNKFKSNSTVSVGFMSRDLSKWLFLMPLSLLGLKIFVIPGVKEYFPLTYTYLVNIISMLSFSVLVYCLFLWYLMLCVFYVIEFYIFLIYSIRSEGIKKPKYLPKFTRDWLSRLEQEGQSEDKEYYIHVYSRNILVNLFLIFLVFLVIWLLI
uniref:hypothetical protein n=1 Tax=Porodaedalea mongolica TaxID=2651638 RepID=UPI0021ACE0C9|nr:hypothetical protein NYK79_mgp11 [Porodaedalea mongolica]UUA03979.1 hypothetical protein [Porodaedalea mongolica]WCF76748.1 hypothetical protein [Porodaedalea mongolica]